MNMKKLITTAFLLIALASVSYGQELIYLHCLNPPQSEELWQGTGLILVIDNESMKWDTFILLKDEELERELDEDEIASRNEIISGTVSMEISRIESSEYFFASGNAQRLDRITGVLTSSISDPDYQHRANCSPLDKASLDDLLQGRIDLRDEMIRENEARRLF